MFVTPAVIFGDVDAGNDVLMLLIVAASCEVFIIFRLVFLGYSQRFRMAKLPTFLPAPFKRHSVNYIHIYISMR